MAPDVPSPAGPVLTEEEWAATGTEEGREGDMRTRTWILAAMIVGSGMAPGAAPRAGEQDALRARARGALKKAASYYRTRVAAHGGYVYYYSLDLSQRWGEGQATADQVWVQPPGTPTVGAALLRAWEATGDRYYLDAARDAASALLYGQLQSGGWQQAIDFDPRGRKVGLYRNGKGGGRNNNSTLDDGITQAALRFLMRMDRAAERRDPAVHEGVRVALDALLKAQYPCGAFPQVWTGPVPATPVLKARYPSYDWRTEGRIRNYWEMYTLNDGVAGHVADVLLDARAAYGDPRYEAALARLGDFLILAQMPEPQPAWAQQYGHTMHPIWARRFEPPAVTGGESQDALRTLMKVYRARRDAKYLEPIPRAIAYLKRSLLRDGRLARYYELQTNRPLYMTRRGDEYSLTYDDAALPEHYGWKVPSHLEEIEAEYRALLRPAPAGAAPPSAPAPADLEARVRSAVESLDAQGRWISTYAGEGLVGQPRFAANFRYLSSATCSANLTLLADYLAPPPPAR
jgi:PelA/Pel-15E family pectate lyase